MSQHDSSDERQPEFPNGQRRFPASRVSGDLVYRATVAHSEILEVSLSESWFKATRSQVGIELMVGCDSAFKLAYVIATRARFSTEYNRFDCRIGEAVVSDYRSYGLTEQQYRTAKATLEKYQFATFRTTGKGTIGKLCDSRLFNPLPSPVNGQTNTLPTDDQRTSNGRPTTNQEGKKERRKDPPPTPSEAGVGMDSGEKLVDSLGRMDDQHRRIVTGNTAPGEVAVPGDGLPKITKINEWRMRLNAIFNRPEDKLLSSLEEYSLAQICWQPNFTDELALIERAYRNKVGFLSQSLHRLLTDWNSNLDKAHARPRDKNGKARDTNVDMLNQEIEKLSRI